MIRTRFAPSPTGYLHIGGLRTALYSYLFAKKNGGKFILRIEDTDSARKVDDAMQIIMDTLKDAGLFYDEGPDIEGAYGPYIQSQRKQIYLDYAKQLVEKGGAYYCFCSKERIESIHANGATKYDKHCLSLTKQQIEEKIKNGEKYVIRQNLPKEGLTKYSDLIFGDITIDFKELEDNVLIKADQMATYNFANVIDDHLMGINYVIRGIEFLSSTPKYNHLYDSFNWTRPNYIHLQPIMKDKERKLSKRHGDASYEDFIKKGFLKEAIINYIALLGWSPKENIEKLSLSDLIDRFSLEGISKSPSIFDEVKMKYINSLYVKELDESEFHLKATPFYEEIDYLKDYDHNLLSRLLKNRVEILSDIERLTRFLIEFENFDLNLLINEKWKTSIEMAKNMLPILIDLLNRNEDLNNLNADLEQVALDNGYKKGQVLWIFRIAITGAKSTPGGAEEMAHLLGRERVIKRLMETKNRLA